MWKISFSCVAAIFGMLCLISCDEEVTNSLTLQDSPGSVLHVQTRSTSLDAAIAQTNVYLFGTGGQCAALLQPDESGDYLSAKLPAGTYTVCAVGSTDLSHFTVPAASEAATTSLVALSSGQTMADLLMASSAVTLSDGEEKTLDLTLLRKVLEISAVTINQVPETVTAVEISLSPLYNGVMLDGTFPASATDSYSFNLTKTADGVWESSESHLIFPSGDTPVITVSFTVSGSDTPSNYTYTLETSLVANCKFNIEGTYTEPQGVILKGALTAQSWNETPQSVTFEFDEQNATSDTNNPGDTAGDQNSGDTGDAPVAGGTYLGYYVVSVNPSAKTAVLLNLLENAKIYTEQTAEEVLSGLAKPAGAVGEWRIPTVAECRIFMADTNLSVNYTLPHYCMDGETLSRLAYTYNGETRVQSSLMPCSYGGSIYLSPVIDIAY